MNPDGSIHATCVAIDGRGVLLMGRSGSGKSDLALRLIDRGARLVSDDYTVVRAEGGLLIASAPAAITDLLEVRGVGLVAEVAVGATPVAMVVQLDQPVERMPDTRHIKVTGIRLPVSAFAAFEASAPLKIERALGQLTSTSSRASAAPAA